MKKNKKLVIFLVIAIIATIILTGILIMRKIQGNGAEGQQGTTVALNKGNIIKATLDDQGNVILKADQLSVNDIKYIRYKENSKVELIATKTEAGEIKIAFNISQTDNEKPNGYFVKDENEENIKCLACGSTFPISEIGAEGGDCRPISIYSEAIEKTEDGIKINGSTLEVNENLFEKIANH